VITAYKNKEWGFKYLSVLDQEKRKKAGQRKKKEGGVLTGVLIGLLHPRPEIATAWFLCY